jgi:GH35 family endo-1,4-beta-xylanase
MKPIQVVIIVTLMVLINGGIVRAEKSDMAASIQKYRTGTIVIKTVPGTKITVNQLKHEFWFGTAISQFVFNGMVSEKDREKYLSILKDNFNSAVHENALKWYSTEKRKGEISYQNADIMLEWCEKNGLRMRGHCVFWSVERMVQPWIKELDNAKLRIKIEQHAREVLARYKGRITEYDVNNEMVHGGFYMDRLGGTIRHEMFDWCHQTDKDTILYVNDYNILSGHDFEKYEKQIASFIEAGVPVGGIGLQGHFGKNGVDPDKVVFVLDRLAKFNLPIKITEFDITTKDEDVKTRGLIDLYTIAFAHPAVDGILMWGFWEGTHWRKDAALWKKNWTPTKAAEAYRNLVYEKWWTKYEGKADDKGICKVSAFFGDHEVSVGGNPPQVVHLRKKEGEKIIDTNDE